MKPKRQKKYTSREMILKDIDRAHSRRRKLEQAAASAEEAMLEARAMKLFSAAKSLQRDVDLIHKRIASITNCRLVKLKSVLAAFDTMLLPMEGNTEAQVVLENLP